MLTRQDAAEPRAGHAREPDENALAEAARMGWALRTLKRMPPTLRRVFILRMIEGKEEGAICAKLNINPARYRLRLARAIVFVADAIASNSS